MDGKLRLLCSIVMGWVSRAKSRSSLGYSKLLPAVSKITALRMLPFKWINSLEKQITYM
jgi:hypothetical protein